MSLKSISTEAHKSKRKREGKVIVVIDQKNKSNKLIYKMLKIAMSKNKPLTFLYGFPKMVNYFCETKFSQKTND